MWARCGDRGLFIFPCGIDALIVLHWFFTASPQSRFKHRMLLGATCRCSASLLRMLILFLQALGLKILGGLEMLDSAVVSSILFQHMVLHMCIAEIRKTLH